MAGAPNRRAAAKAAADVVLRNEGPMTSRKGEPLARNRALEYPATAVGVLASGSASHHAAAAGEQRGRNDRGVPGHRAAGRALPGTLTALLAGAGAERIVTEPNLGDDTENQVRRQLLTAHRGYGTDTGLFNGFPSEVAWAWMGVTPAELATVRYIDYDY